MSGAVTGQRKFLDSVNTCSSPVTQMLCRGTEEPATAKATTAPRGHGPRELVWLALLSEPFRMHIPPFNLLHVVQSFQEPREGEGSRQRDMPPALAVLPLKPHSGVKQWASARLPSLPGTRSSTRGPAWLFLGGAPADSQGAGPRRLHRGG